MQLTSAEIVHDILKPIIARNIKPHLAIVQIGDNPESNLYIKVKTKRINELGFNSAHLKLSESIDLPTFSHQISQLSTSPEIHGIIVQLPIPEKLKRAIDLIPYYKDVDGLTSINQGRLMQLSYTENNYIAPCTALGVMSMLNWYKVNLVGSRVAIFGKSSLVGRPINLLLQNAGATTISINKSDKNQSEMSSQCDIIVSAMGQPKYIKSHFVKKNAFVVDVGVTKINNIPTGDVDPIVEEKTKFITPVISGIGPLTVAFLIKNLVKCYDLQNNI